jgi:hypothetical protein
MPDGQPIMLQPVANAMPQNAGRSSFLRNAAIAGGTGILTAGVVSTASKANDPVVPVPMPPAFPPQSFIGTEMATMPQPGAIAYSQPQTGVVAPALTAAAIDPMAQQQQFVQVAHVQ